MAKTVHQEVFLLRCAACLSIVMLHALGRVYGVRVGLVNDINLMLAAGTPIFVFISEFILSFSYPDKVPGQFWEKRVKFLLLPYLFFGTFYAAMKAIDASSGKGSELTGAFLGYWWRHILLGDYHGYFILIIFQFYLLHVFFVKYIHRYSPKRVLTAAFLVNMAYLGFFNFTAPSRNPVALYIWDKFYWIPFAGWVFYFALAYYCGKNIGMFQEALRRRSKLVVALPILFGGLALYVYNTGLITSPTSKRVDMVFFTVSVIFLLYLAALRMKRIPRAVVWISRYSFGIYLFHPFYLAILYKSVSRFVPAGWGAASALLLFTAAVLLSSGTLYVLNRFRFGKYVAGRIGIGNGPERPEGAIDKGALARA